MKKVYASSVAGACCLYRNVRKLSDLEAKSFEHDRRQVVGRSYEGRV